jgi:hypothetical protein
MNDLDDAAAMSDAATKILIMERIMLSVSSVVSS